MSTRTAPGTWKHRKEATVILGGKEEIVPHHIVVDDLTERNQRRTRFVAQFNGSECSNEADCAFAVLADHHMDKLVAALRETYEILDDRYDVDTSPLGRTKEYPFSGCGELMQKIRAVLDAYDKEQS